MDISNVVNASHGREVVKQQAGNTDVVAAPIEKAMAVKVANAEAAKAKKVTSTEAKTSGVNPDDHSQFSDSSGGVGKSTAHKLPGQGRNGVSIEEAEAAKDALTGITEYFNRELVFEVDPDSKEIKIMVVDGESREIIRQIPAEEVLDIGKKVVDLRGVLLDITE